MKELYQNNWYQTSTKPALASGDLSGDRIAGAAPVH